MKQDICDLWVRELRSGKWKQRQGSLANLERTEHCCLGVLCELAIEHGVNIEAKPDFNSDNERLLHFGEPTPNLPEGVKDPYVSVSYLPAKVKEWAGMKTRDGVLPMAAQDELESKFGGACYFSLVDLNDKPDSSFRQVADIIDRYGEDL